MMASAACANRWGRKGEAYYNQSSTNTFGIRFEASELLWTQLDIFLSLQRLLPEKVSIIWGWTRYEVGLEVVGRGE